MTGRFQQGSPQPLNKLVPETNIRPLLGRTGFFEPEAGSFRFRNCERYQPQLPATFPVGPPVAAKTVMICRTRRAEAEVNVTGLADEGWDRETGAAICSLIPSFR